MTDERYITPLNVGVPTQVANPTRTTIRSVVQAVIGTLVVGVPLLNSILGALNNYLLEQEDVAVPAWVFLVLNAGLAVTALLIGALARIMAVPGVADFIVKHLPWLAPIKPPEPAPEIPQVPGNVG